MRKYIIQFVLCSVLIAAILSGCAKAPEEGSKNNIYQLEGNHISGQLAENLALEGTFVGTDLTEASVLQVRFDDGPSVDDVAKLLFHGTYKIEEHPIEKATYTAIADSISGYESLLYASASNLIDYRGPESEKYEVIQLVTPDTEPEFYRSRWAETLPGAVETELADFSGEEAKAICREYFDKLEIQVMPEPYVIMGLTPEELERLAQESKYVESYTKPEKGCYYMLWELQLEGIPIISGNYPEMGSSEFHVRDGYERGSLAVVILNTDGIQKLEIRSNQYQILEQQEAQPLKSLEEIIGKIPDYYENTLLQDVHTINKVQFCYVPVLKELKEEDNGTIGYFEMIPSWIAEVQYKPTGRNHFYFDIIYINAITGEIIH